MRLYQIEEAINTITNYKENAKSRGIPLIFRDPLLTQVTIASFSSRGDSASLKEAYQISQKFPHKILRVGDWARRELQDVSGAILPQQEPLGQHMFAASPEKPAEQDILLLHPVDQPRLESAGHLGRGSWGRSRAIKTRALRNGVMRAPTDDPLRFREDLTGLHLRCATLPVRG